MSVEGELDGLWARYRSAWKRLLSPGMVKELQLRSMFDVTPISPKKIANQIPKGTIPDCAACEDLCCVGIENVVSLRLKDVAVLIDIGRTDLITKMKPNFPRSMQRTRPMLWELVGSELWRTLPVLKQLGESRICAALTPDLRCSIHPHWPTSCERFPYSLQAKKKAVTWGTRCPSKTCAPEHAPRGEEMFQGSVLAYNERIMDAVLIAHARTELDRLGIGDWLLRRGEDPFEPRRPQLPIIE